MTGQKTDIHRIRFADGTSYKGNNSMQAGSRIAAALKRGIRIVNCEFTQGGRTAVLAFASDFLTKRCTSLDAARAVLGEHLPALRSAGFELKDFLEARFTTDALVSIGFSAQDFMREGF